MILLLSMILKIFVSNNLIVSFFFNSDKTDRPSSNCVLSIFSVRHLVVFAREGACPGINLDRPFFFYFIIIFPSAPKKIDSANLKCTTGQSNRQPNEKRGQ